MIITIDIETIPTQRQDLREYIASNIKPPKTMSVAATIEKWHKESKQAAIDDAIGMTGLDGAFGQVCVIGYEFDGMPTPETVHGLCEDIVLAEFNNVLDTVPRHDWFTTVIVGHNVASFDLRFLMNRYVVNGIKPHVILSRAASAKPWEIEKVFDTMIQWNPDREKRISLDKLCTVLGVPTSKGDMDGSKVGQYVADGRIDDVVAYCKRDVIATRDCYKRMTFQ